MRSLLLFALAAFISPLSAWSQDSSVQLGGIIDAGVRYDRGAANGGRTVSLGSGQLTGSRLTFSGSEDLGSGLRAVFVLEAGLSIDTGTGTSNPPGATPGAITFGRTSMVGLGSDRYGYVTMGRQYTPLWSVSASPTSDPFAGSWLGGQNVVYSNTVRTSNSIVYSYGYGPTTMLRPAPRSGWGFAAMYAPSETTDQSPSGAGRQYGFNVSYGARDWWIGYGFHSVRGNDASINPAAPTAAQPHLRQQTLAAYYDLRVVRLHAGINAADNNAVGSGSVKRRSWTIGATIPFASVHTVRLLYGRANNRALANADFRTFQVGYQYDASKRTALYAAYGRVENDAASAATLTGAAGTPGAGNAPSSLIAGIRHIF